MKKYPNTKWKRRLALLAGALLLAGSLAGCGRQGSSGGIVSDAGTAEKGAWLEKEAALTGIPEGATLKQVSAVDDRLRLVTAVDESGGFRLQEWELQEDTFTEVTEGWLADFVIPGESWMDISLMRDGSGVQYLFYSMLDTELDAYRGYLWRGDGDEATEITPEKWAVVNEEYGFYDHVTGIAALKNGTLAALSYLSADRISGEDGSVLESTPVTGYYEGDMITDGENVYLRSMGMTGSIEAVEKWQGGSMKDTVTIPMDENTSSIPQICVLPDGTLFFADGGGIFRCEAGAEDWEKLIAGPETSFSLTSCWCTGLAALQDGRIYALFHESGDVAKLLLYEYDPEAVPVVSTVLKLYAVEESYLLQNAAGLYHRAHPDVMIEVECAYTREDRYSDVPMDYNTVQQQINTMLMGSEAPDILVLDHLNKESYAEKGLLTDIQDIVAPMEESGELISNIMQAYHTEDGKQYIVPMQFGFTFALGRDITAQDMASMRDLGAFLAGKSESYLGSRTVTELVDMFYPYFCGNMVEDKELNREVLAEYLEALKQIADNCGVIEKRDKNERGYNMWELASTAKLAMEESDGFNGSMFPLAMADYIKGEFNAFENTFTPYVEMGVSSKSEYQDVAKDFIAFCLSEEVQRQDYYIGYPVNVGCLEDLAAADRSDATAETMIEIGDGASELFTIGEFSEEVAQRLVTLCKGLDRPRKEDAKIREVLIDTLPGYLQGTQSLEETLDQIDGGLRMYLAE
ncbi:MAG: extracellular solute-binding protein [Lachnospiraceae bacterium]|nr:extracellular solute-binding protein [Butyrivibrio sp.]MCM1343915.1 extracellular solute-binding protein [Muribaculaceae bacterium]MCM1412257.1 extracellular solute-binding protein [Lachnospiraceae bacterium]